MIKLSADEELTVYADPVKLARVFNHILKNAISYSYPNTEIKVNSKKEQGNIIVSFQNQGKTIPYQRRGALFDKFFRAVCSDLDKFSFMKRLRQYNSCNRM